LGLLLVQQGLGQMALGLLQQGLGQPRQGPGRRQQALELLPRRRQNYTQSR
jgi:hypothetical protein